MPRFKEPEKDFNKERQGLSDRLRQQYEFEETKRKLKEETNKGLISLNKQFSKSNCSATDTFKAETIGLVSASEFREKRKRILDIKRFGEMQAQKNLKNINDVKIKTAEREENIALKNRIKTGLSFNPYEEDEDLPEKVKIRKKSLKNPNVDTSFLPDKKRDEENAKLRLKLKREWIEKQDIIKRELLEVTFVYWDGSGHRNKLLIEKGNTIRNFLERAKESLVSHFIELKNVSGDDLIYVKDDSIIPPSLTFYELIACESMGKTSKLFILNSKVKEMDENENAIVFHRDDSRAGKIVTRNWFERNRHMYPASNWINFIGESKSDEE